MILGLGVLATRSDLIRFPETSPEIFVLAASTVLTAVTFSSIVGLSLRSQAMTHPSYVNFIRKHFLHCLSAQLLALILIFSLLKSLPLVDHLHSSSKMLIMALDMTLVLVALSRMKLSRMKRLILGLISVGILTTSSSPELAAYACLTPIFLAIGWLSKRLPSLGPTTGILSGFCFMTALAGLTLSANHTREGMRGMLIGTLLTITGGYGISVSRQLIHLDKGCDPYVH